MQPQNPNFEADLRAAFAKQAMMRAFQAEILEVGPGLTVLGMPFLEQFTQHHGFLHAGAVTTMLDNACGFAAFSLMPAGHEVLSVEFKTNLLRPAVGDRFRFRGEVLKPGRVLTVVEAKAYAITEAGEKLIASMTGTMIAMAEGV